MFKLIFSILTLLFLVAGATTALAQPSPPQAAQGQQPPKAPKAKEKAAPAPAVPYTYSQDQVPVEPVKVQLAKGGKVAISSRAGQIFVSGWDRDVVQASATGDNGPVPIETQTSGDPARPRLLLRLSARRFSGEAKVDVKVPRYADVETLEGYRGDIQVTDVDGATLINAGNGDVRVVRAGTVKVSRRTGDIRIKDLKGDLTARSFSGDVVVDNVAGLVDVAATNGDLRIQNAGGDVRTNSATGDTEIRCAKGRADVASASGSITLIGVGGEVEASTASGDVTFRGAMRSSGSYRLKSLSGNVSMTIQPDAPGFTATLTTYSGEINTDFPLKLESPVQTGAPLNRRLIGTFGNGQTKLFLDSFSGTVRIAKGTAAMLKECK
ncbi:MAG TPA: DUF4097 family beta strand repeat-containing protein [Blastocatellia bacterium]|nr:DUF4097 family beta strand repeat-containing protein [Blastocatellia bacterium]